jgi:hypothetical protein
MLLYKLANPEFQVVVSCFFSVTVYTASHQTRTHVLWPAERWQNNCFSALLSFLERILTGFGLWSQKFKHDVGRYSPQGATEYKPFPSLCSLHVYWYIGLLIHTCDLHYLKKMCFLPYEIHNGVYWIIHMYLCNIWRYHGFDVEDSGVQGFYAA